ncbi:hypothetical protein Scep_002281 [Stephania cephalantha]|uniref:Uncharacterized protein n=1 Tax=Stephania cephalantha TaxID=152367 RepID=A0AAP0LAQ4_9MAGN
MTSWMNLQFSFTLFKLSFRDWLILSLGVPNGCLWCNIEDLPRPGPLYLRYTNGGLHNGFWKEGVVGSSNGRFWS